MIGKCCFSVWLAAILFALPACDGASGDAAKAQAIYASDGDAALSQVKDFAVGTWTSTVPGDFWFRIVVDTNGAITWQMVPPSASDWEDPTIGKIVPVTGKYGDTGERWYGFKMDDVPMTLVIRKDGTLSYFDVGHENLTLSHHDASPFSK